MRTTLLLRTALVVTAAALIASCSSDDEAATTTTEPDAPESEDDGTLERYVGATSDVYADLTNWLCHPGPDDVCDGDLDATVVEADGTLTEEPWEAAEDPAVDCFYVYPTISADTTEISDRVPGEEERFVVLNQAARLGETCRVFAPVYRQRTLAGLTAALGGASGSTTTTAAGGEASDGESPPSPGYTDVLDSFRHYMATENQGRGVVLIGHSQGAGVLNQLVQEEIDPNDDVRDRLVAAYLVGSAVRVPPGQDVGGDFDSVPLCRSEDQTGCVLSWASFRDTQPPPPDALFGRPRTGGGTAACTNPAALGGGPAEVASYFPASPGSSILSSLGVGGDGGDGGGEGASWVDPSVGEVTTPFVTTPGLVTAECVERDGFSYLEVTVDGDPDDPRIDEIGGDLTPQWGLHLQDVNLLMGDIVELVGEQAAAHTGRG